MATTSNSRALFSTFIISLVIIGFMFTGYNTLVGPGNNEVGKVGSVSISQEEFQTEIQRQSYFFSQILNQGKPLTQKQIKERNLYGQAFNNLVSKKLFINFALDNDMVPGKNEISKYIENQSYFKTDGKFDFGKYKNIISNSPYKTLSNYEELVKSDLVVSQLNNTFKTRIVSDQYVKEVLKIKERKLNLEGVKVLKDSLRSFVKVTDKEISDFLKKEENKAKVETLFASKKAQWTVPEKVEASHLLLKANEENDKDVLKKITALRKGLTPSNFGKVASKNTEDPSGKGTGGSLGSFSRGQMVPAFEKVVFDMKPGTISKPVKTQFGYHLIYLKRKLPAINPKISDKSTEIATELLQREKRKEHVALIESLKNDLKNHYEKGAINQVSSLKNRYKFTKVDDKEIDLLGSSPTGLGLEISNIFGFFQDFNGQSMVKVIDSHAHFVIVRITPPKPAKKDIKEDSKKNEGPDFDKESKTLANAYTSKFRKEATEYLKKETKIKQFVKFN